MVRLSIIVPAVGSQSDLDDTLVSVLSNRPEACEVLVPHGPDYQDPYALDDEVRFIPVDSDSWPELLTAGVRAARSSLVHTLRTGIQVSEDWTDAAIERLREDEILAAVSATIVHGEKSVKVASAGVRAGLAGTARYVARGQQAKSLSDRQLAKLDGVDLSAAFLRREAIIEMGGFDSRLDGALLSLDTGLKLQALEWDLCSAAEVTVRGTAVSTPTGFRAARHNEWVYWRHRDQRPFSVRGGMHWLAVCAQSLAMFPRPAMATQMLGRLVGLLESQFGQVAQWDPPSCDADDEDVVTLPFATDGKTEDRAGTDVKHTATRYSRSA